MKQGLSKEVIKRISALGIYHITGGILGIGFIFFAIINSAIVSSVLLLIYFIFFLLYGHSVYCGILLLKKKKPGLNHSLANQILQVINFTVSGFTFEYISGIYFSIGVMPKDQFMLAFNFGLSSWKIVIGGNSELLILNFNIVSFILVLMIDKMRKRLNAEATENEIKSIGESQNI